MGRLNNLPMIFTTIVALTLLLSNVSCCLAQLLPSVYRLSCPLAAITVRSTIQEAVLGDPRMAASLIRLFFLDCFVQGCDGSVLLDESPTIQSEKTALRNINSARGFEVIEAAKARVERLCPGVVSCADILALAARDSSVIVGAPLWRVKLGRRDSITANRSAANIELPSPFDDLDTLISKFAAKGFSAREMVALSGAHTIGLAQCFVFRDRIYANGTDGAGIDPDFATSRRRRCPPTGDDTNLAPLDFASPEGLDNMYFKNLIEQKGLLKSDQVLFNNGSTDAVVLEYSQDSDAFREDFKEAMIKMGDIKPLVGRKGIIRRVCNAID